MAGAKELTVCVCHNMCVVVSPSASSKHHLIRLAIAVVVGLSSTSGPIP